MRKTRTVYRFYAAWEFERELRDLEAMSKSGWQLVRGGIFRCAFAFDDTVEYRYALDFNKSISDPARYRETFAEQGWEYLNSTLNGWHYFRKPYDPSLPEEEYRIYTDAASGREMADRWRRVALILGAAELLLGAAILASNLLYPAIHSICLGLACVLLGLMLVLGAGWIASPDRRRPRARMLIPVMALLVLSLVYGGLRMRGLTTRTEYIVPEDQSAWEFEFDVTLPDIYTLDIRFDAPENVTVVLAKDSPASPIKYYTATGKQIDQSIHILLTPGTYTLSTRYHPGSQPGLTGEFEYRMK